MQLPQPQPLPSTAAKLHPDLTWQHFDSIDSTNAYLLAHEQPSNLLVTATSQTHGRGRHQQSWKDEGESLLFSLSTPFIPNKDLSAWPVQVAITLATTLNALAEQVVKVKWPNDLYTLNSNHEWGKFCGILVESSIGKTGKMVTGAGINLSPLSSPPAADYPIAYWESEIDKSALAVALANQLYRSWQQFLNTATVSPHEFHPIDLLADSPLIATELTFPNTTTSGRGAGINEQGHLLLQQGGKTTAITNQQRIRFA